MPVPAAGGDDALTARITLRLPDSLKVQIEVAASREGVSTNSWIVRALARGLESRPVRHRPAPDRLRRRLKGASMISFHPAPYGHVVLPEPDFGLPAPTSPPDQRVVRPARRKGGRRGAGQSHASRRPARRGCGSALPPAASRSRRPRPTETTVELEALRYGRGHARRRSSRRRSSSAATRSCVEIAKQGWGFLGRSPAGRDPHPLPVRLRTRLHDRVGGRDAPGPARRGERQDRFRGHRARRTSAAPRRPHRERRRPRRHRRRRARS